MSGAGKIVSSKGVLKPGPLSLETSALTLLELTLEGLQTLKVWRLQSQRI
jgi:hypothetical protein